MSQTEQNYAQIEKELLATVFACEKFDQYIFGRSGVIVQSDHRLLQTIFKKPIHSSPKRLQRMRLRLQHYGIHVEYKGGTTMFLADTLSRAYLENELVRPIPHSDICSLKYSFNQATFLPSNYSAILKTIPLSLAFAFKFTTSL